ncbi:unnamed protein product [Adineta ricciae]|uniref:Chloride channel CLIC-like protein 1 n=1 Tax=Adineta ricciae TaxID=249248 RepID=A0A814S091_ADIRI|nr:unnamed protein product [Adineta ricciae]CAF1453202.1 unnamed protein product [Adineta ricciae]
MLRCVLLAFFITGAFVSADVFDIFNDPIKPKPEVVEVETKQTTMKPPVTQKNTNVVNPNAYKEKYLTILNTYRSVIGNWMKMLPSEDVGLYRMIVKLSPDTISRFKAFASNAQSDETKDLHEVHMVSKLLNDATLRIEEIIPSFSKKTLRERLRSVDIEKILLGALLATAIGLIAAISVQARNNFRRSFKVLFTFIFIISVLQNCYGFYLEELAKIDTVLIKTLPQHCLSYSHGFFHTMKLIFTRTVQAPHDDCLEYQKALRNIPHARATLAKAVSLTVAQLFITPIGEIGESISAFFAGLMRHVPFVASPIVILSVLFFLFILIMTRSQYALTSVYGLLSFHPVVAPDVTKSPEYLKKVNQLELKEKECENLKQKINELKQLTLPPPNNTTSSIISPHPVNSNIPLSDESPSLSEQTTPPAEVPLSEERGQDVPVINSPRTGFTDE